MLPAIASATWLTISELAPGVGTTAAHNSTKAVRTDVSTGVVMASLVQLRAAGAPDDPAISPIVQGVRVDQRGPARQSASAIGRLRRFATLRRDPRNMVET